MIERLNAALEGRYRIEGELGEGGMATVYLAHDVKHDRQVALKVLRPELAAVVGADRFLAEIKTTANLQHPHILPLFDSGEADSFLFYVMPYVEGETLRDRLHTERQLSVDEAVDIARKVAGALHYAHENEVVHRDVKPANILMNRGEPLVADFGIALALSEAGGGRITETGLSLGTPHYMSPEQASGDRSLDKRSDVYALGCILYELLTGEPPHGGPTPQSVLAKILTDSPRRITELRRTVPPNVDAAVAKALEKLPADRFASADAFARALTDESFRHSVQGGPLPTPTSAPGSPWRQPAAWGLAGAAAVAGLAVGFMLRPPPPPEPVFKAALSFPEGQEPAGAGFGRQLEITPDGSTLLYTGLDGAGSVQLWSRRADALSARPVPGTQGILSPTLSPNGSQVAVLQTATNRIMAIDLESGTSRTILADSAGPIIDWGPDGMIYFFGGGTLEVFRVPEEGGRREAVPGLNAVESQISDQWGWGEVLPGGSTALWTRYLAENDRNVILRVDLDGGEEPSPLVEGSSPRYLASGHLVWVTPDQTVVMAPFDPDAVEITGQPAPVADDIALDQFLTIHAAFSDRGDLVYRTGGSLLTDALRLAWIDRSGNTTPVDPDWTIQATAGGWDRIALSPDGTRVVVTDGSDGVSQLWVKELTEDTPPFRITFESQFNARPVWTPDGDSLVYVSDRGGRSEPTQLWQRAADGSGEPRLLLAADREIEEVIVSPDGAWLVYRLGGTATNRDIYHMRLAVDTTGTPLVATGADEKTPALSPDGRWLAYVSDRTGTHQVFVRPFPDVSAGVWQVSRNGGVAPVWSPTGDEIFYVGGGNMMAAGVRIQESSFAVTHREPLFSTAGMLLSPAGNSRSFDVSADGERLLVFESAVESGEQQFVWIRNWMAAWRRRADPGGS